MIKALVIQVNINKMDMIQTKQTQKKVTRLKRGVEVREKKRNKDQTRQKVMTKRKQTKKKVRAVIQRRGSRKEAKQCKKIKKRKRKEN